MRKIRIGLMCDSFIEWGGGIDFLRLCLNGLTSLKKNNSLDIQIILLIPKKSSIELFKNFVKRNLNRILANKRFADNVIDYNAIISDFYKIDKNVEPIFYKRSLLARLVLNKEIDIVLPSFKTLPKDFPVAWIGYLYDLQHKHLSNFFTQKEIQKRDHDFKMMLKNAKSIIVNSVAVLDDIKLNYSEFYKTNSIHPLPFCPVLNEEYFNDDALLVDYKLPSQFFLISNQFWLHKDHLTAFKALRIFIDETGYNNVSIVCTGKTYDYRFPNYFTELKKSVIELNLENNISILGYIKKRDQLKILSQAIAVIQPTLFEGGPGGGAVYESVAYGVRSIVSDIPVNLEITDNTVTFFKTSSEKDLSQKMIKLYFEPYTQPSKQNLEIKNMNSLQNMGHELFSLINNTISSN